MSLEIKSVQRLCARLLHCVTRHRKNEIAERLREELGAHLEAQTEAHLRAGITPEKARRNAQLRLGSLEAVRESYHAESRLPLLENMLFDLRYALRVLGRTPAFTIVAIVTLMLGIGANVVVFGVLNALLLRPLAVSSPQNLYQLRLGLWTKGRLLTTSYPAFEDFRQRNTTFTDMAGVYGYSGATLSWQANAPLAIHGDEVTGNYFDMLGVAPVLGRFFHESDEHGPDSAPYVVLSNTLWRNAFHANPQVVGSTVELNHHPFAVVGVASPQFHGTERFVWPDYWIPMVNKQQIDGWDALQSRAAITVTVIGRLKPGATPRQATDDLNAVAAGLAKAYPNTDEGVSLRLIHPGLYGDEGDTIREFMWSVTTLALLVLAAACANLASLFSARAADRSRELALRVALGSSRQRLVRQLLTEAILVSLVGGAAGLGTAALLLRVLNRWQSPYGHLAISVDAHVYLAGVVCTLGSALCFGLAPVRQVWRSTPMQAMKGGQSGLATTLHVRRFALRDLLLGAQIAICTLLVTASLVAVRGMMRELHAPLGFEPQGAMLAHIDLSEAGPSETGAAQLAQKEALLGAASRIPGVTAAGAVSRTPMTGGMHGVPVFRPGTSDLKLSHALAVPYVFPMAPGYLHAAETRLLRGRDVSWHDTADTPAVAVVNQTFARRLWGAHEPIGQRFLLSGRLTEVVGVAEDGKYHDLAEASQPVVYPPFAQSDDNNEATFVVRSPLAPNQVAAALEHTLASSQPNARITVEGWADSLDGEFFPARAATVALGVMGLLASMLAVTGIFGMAAYSVSQRMKELGIRAALGARKTQVMRAAIGRPIVLLGAGSTMGLLASVLASRLMAQIVFQPDPQDPFVLMGVVMTMALIGVVASAIPARRALAIDPAKLLRED